MQLQTQMVEEVQCVADDSFSCCIIPTAPPTDVTPAALDAIADQALTRGTGARGLRAILEEVLLNTMYELPGRTDIERVVVDVDAVVEKASPTLVPRTARVARQRRAAS